MIFIGKQFFREIKLFKNILFFPSLVEPIVSEPCEPNPCGPYSTHRERNNQCICSCLPEYIGDPPNCRPECLVNSECSQNLACIDQRCASPCRPGICGLNAECNVINHNAICSCLPGYQGAPDAFIRCDRSKNNDYLIFHHAIPIHFWYLIV